MKTLYFALTLGAAAVAATSAAASELQDMAKTYVIETLGAALSTPEVAAAVHAQNERNAGLDAAAIEALDQQWRAGDAAMIDAALSNDLSKYLASIVDEQGGLVSELFVMDSKGLNVGQSARTSDYWQGDEAKWSETYLVGPDAVHVSDIEEDESTQTFQVQVSLPIVDGGAPIGAITVGVNVSALEDL